MGLTVVSGFARTYYGPLTMGGPRATLTGGPWTVVVHAHAALFTAWVVLFIVQTALISSRRVAVHRRLGIAGALLAAAMVAAGVLMAIAAGARQLSGGCRPARIPGDSALRPGVVLRVGGIGLRLLLALQRPQGVLGRRCNHRDVGAAQARDFRHADVAVGRGVAHPVAGPITRGHRRAQRSQSKSSRLFRNSSRMVPGSTLARRASATVFFICSRNWFVSVLRTA